MTLFIKESGYQVRRQDLHSYNVRSGTNLHTPFERLSVTQNNPKYMGIKLLNHLFSLDKKFLDMTNFRVFKYRLRKFLIERCYYSIDEFLDDTNVVE